MTTRLRVPDRPTCHPKEVSKCLSPRVIMTILTIFQSCGEEGFPKLCVICRPVAGHIFHRSFIQFYFTETTRQRQRSRFVRTIIMRRVNERGGFTTPCFKIWGIAPEVDTLTTVLSSPVHAERKLGMNTCCKYVSDERKFVCVTWHCGMDYHVLGEFQAPQRCVY